jgi:hypothetical protein
MIFLLTLAISLAALPATSLHSLVAIANTGNHQQGQTGILQAQILDAKAQPLAGAVVTIFNAAGEQVGATHTANEKGEVQIGGLPIGAYRLQVDAEGYQQLIEQDVKVVADNVTSASLQMAEKTDVKEIIVVPGQTDNPIEQTAAPTGSFKQETLKTAPALTHEYDALLPTVPNVIRGPDGKVSIKGTSENKNAFLVNNADSTDPATGAPSISIPLESIEQVQVYTNPYLPEYGRFTGGVTKVETRRGGDKFKFEFDDLFPEPRFRGGHLFGITNFSPRLHLEGPLVKNRFYFSQGLEYDVDKKPVRGLPSPINEIKKQVARSFTQLDFIISPQHLFTITANYSPAKIEHVNLDFFNPQVVAPNRRSTDTTLAGIDRYTLSGGSLLETQLQYKRISSHVYGNGPLDELISPEGRDGNYFHAEQRTTDRYEIMSTDTLPSMTTRYGIHNVKLGADVNYLSNTGSNQDQTVNITRTDGTIAQKINYFTAGSLNASNAQAAAFAQDQWLIRRNLNFDYGLRFEAQRDTAGFSVMPRVALAYSPTGNGNTVLRSAFGLFYDKVPLNALSFVNEPRPIVTTFAADGTTIIDGPRFFNLVLAPRPGGQPNFGSDFAAPRNTTFNLELDQKINQNTLLKVAYLDSRTQHDLYVSPEFVNGENTITLFNNGRLQYRSLELTTSFKLPNSNDLSVSYIRSRARGELNDFGAYYGDYPEPIIRENQFANLPSDAPNRLLMRGNFKLPYQFTVVPLLDYHTGFPYSIVDEQQNFVGPRDSDRFPRFFSLDMAITKDVRLRDKYTAQFTVSLFNATDHFNPRNVHNNIADPNFGTFFASYRRFYRLDFAFVW